MIKAIVILSVVLGGCSTVKKEVKTLQDLRVDCENLQLELDSLGAKKWTKVIDKKVKDCEDHGFWTKSKRVRSYVPSIDSDLE